MLDTFRSILSPTYTVKKADREFQQLQLQCRRIINGQLDNIALEQQMDGRQPNPSLEAERKHWQRVFNVYYKGLRQSLQEFPRS